MTILQSLVAIALLLQASPPAGAPDSPEMTIAKANKPRMKVSPVFLSGPDADFPEAARAAGEHGKVIVAGIISADGRFLETRVAESSHSPILDASALAAASATLFKPARDADGTALSMPARMPFTFDNVRSPGKGGGVLRYRCDQFVRDNDWWQAHWGPNQRDDFHTTTAGYVTLLHGRDKNGQLEVSRFLAANKDFDKEWQGALDACRKAPESLFLEVFKPDGDALRDMARK